MCTQYIRRLARDLCDVRKKMTILDPPPHTLVHNRVRFVQPPFLQYIFFWTPSLNLPSPRSWLTLFMDIVFKGSRVTGGGGVSKGWGLRRGATSERRRRDSFRNLPRR